jgi:hypothetical protein
MMEPTVRKPKPRTDSAPMSSQFLSKPAARPTGLGKVNTRRTGPWHGIVDSKCRGGCEHAPRQGRAQGQMPDRVGQIRRQGEQRRPDEALITAMRPRFAE